MIWPIVRGAWTAVSEVEDHRSAAAFALCAALLQPQLFSVDGPEDTRRDLHAEDGPLHWLVTNLLKHSLRTVRMRAAAAAQLAAAWVTQPELATMYLPQLRSLLLDGLLGDGIGVPSTGVAPDGVVGVGAYQAALRQVGDDVAVAWADTLMAPRVAALCCAHGLATCPEGRPVGLELWQDLFHAAQNDSELTSANYKIGGVIHRRKVRLWQALCVLCHVVEMTDAAPTLQKIMTVLQANDVPTIRQYQEYVARHLLLAAPHLAAPTLLPILQDYAAKKVEIVSSIALLALHFLLWGPRSHIATLEAPIVAALVPWGMHHNHGVKTLSLLVLKVLSEEAAHLFIDDSASHSRAAVAAMAFRAAGGDATRLRALAADQPALFRTASSGSMGGGPGDNSPMAFAVIPEEDFVESPNPLAAVASFLASSADVARLRATIVPSVMTPGPVASVTPAGVLYRSDNAAKGDLEGARPALVDAIATFLNEQRQALRTRRIAYEGSTATHADNGTATPKKLSVVVPSPVHRGDDIYEASTCETDPPRSKDDSSPAGSWLPQWVASFSPAAPSTGGGGSPRGGNAPGWATTTLSPAASATVEGNAPGWAAAVAPPVTPAPSAARAGHQRKVLPVVKAAVVAAMGDRHLAPVGLSDAGLLQAQEVDEQMRAAMAAAPRNGRGGANGEGIVVIATLVNKTPNVAGLVRTCEVLGAVEIVVADKSVTTDPAFRGISVTAENWLPMREVGVGALGNHLKELRRSGWTLVGVEQTGDSVPLTNYRFPAKTALLLGKEIEGIPQGLLDQLDAVVEIPQAGIIRSLNVHVAGGIAIAEFVRQHGVATG